ncbi:MAG: GIY-YIG nuclease family protein [Granulosicoccaceae bacterium]
MSQWTVYILRCADGSLYTGITTNIDRRIQEHNEGNRGAAYTRGRRPVQLVYQFSAADRADASKHEHSVKKLSRSAKEQLIGS